MINFQKVWNEKCKKYGEKEQISIFPKVRRIIVIGDIHGDYNMMINSLKIGKLIDDNDNWIGEDTYVVQVGDQIDRCRPNGEACDKQLIDGDKDDDFKILKYFTDLHNKAKQYNGAVISLLGNHELMNIDGNLNYVSMAGLGLLGTDNPDSYFKSKDDRINKFSRGNEISNFLACTRYIAIIIGSNLFAHAGIVSKIASEYNLRSINQIMTLFLLSKFDKEQYIYESEKKYFLNDATADDIFYNSNYSPLWNRIYGYMGYFYENNDTSVYNNEEEIKKECSKHLNILKEIYKVDKIYVGHTPMLNNGITSVCNGKVWLTDYGASHAFDKMKDTNKINYVSVLEILNDGFDDNITIIK